MLSVAATAAAASSLSAEETSGGATAGVRVVPATPTIGADVYGFDLARPLSDAELRLVDELFLKHKVLFFRNQSPEMTTADQMRFVQDMGRHWGLAESTNRTPQAALTTEDGVLVAPIFPRKVDKDSGQVVHPAVLTVGSRASAKEAGSQVAYAKVSGGELRPFSVDDKDRAAAPPGPEAREVGDTHVPTAKIWNDVAKFPTGTLLGRQLPRSRLQGERGRGTLRRVGQEELFSANVWHSDNMWMENPPWATVLRAVSVLKTGGDTCFANMDAVYDDLDDATQRYLESLRQFTDWEPIAPGVRLSAERKNSFDALEEMKRNFPPAEHPVIRTHPQTGKKCVFVSPMYCQGIKGMPGEEAAPLLRELFALTSTPEYTCRLKWEPGTVTMYDNRCVQHYATADYQEEQQGGTMRLLEHIGSMGDKPF